ncbi:LacI family DNA-binding transcriptional regulator [Arthrobacter sp. Sr24]
MAGIKEVAELSGLSIATVSRALGGKGSVSAKSRKLAQDAAAELGFVLSYAASSLASGRNHNIGIVVPGVNRWFYSSVIDGASEVLIEAGYDLTLYTTSQNESHRATILTDFLLRKRLDAVIAVSLELTESEVSQLLAIHRPVLGIGGPLPGADSLRVDDFELAKRATEHLIGLGHTRIAHIGGDHEYDSDFKLPGTRRSGYQTAMEQAQLPTSEAWQRSSDFTVQGAYTTARALLGGGLMRPTAVFAASDEMAIGTILAARDFGLRVPEELSVIGIDGHELGQVFGLTTFDQKPREQGALAAHRILARLDQSSQDAAVTYEPVAEEFPTQLVVRSSTAVPPAE